MYFMLNNRKLKKPLFKKRYLKKVNYKKISNSLFFKNKVLVDLDFFKKILFRLKRIYKKKKIKLFINLNRNHIISKKPKNSRMGKGKGKFSRFVYKIVPYKPVISIPSISQTRFNSLLNHLNCYR